MFEIRQYVAGELFEKQVYEFGENHTVFKVFQDGEEVRKEVEVIEDLKTAKDYFENGELLERHFTLFNEDHSIETNQIFDVDNKLIGTRYQYYDQKARVIKYIEKNENDQLLIQTDYAYTNDLLTLETTQNFAQDDHYRIEYEYDDKQNLISQEIKTPTGKMLEFQKFNYDQFNRLIFETGFSIGGYAPIYGSYVNSEKYTFEHEYVEIDEIGINEEAINNV